MWVAVARSGDLGPESARVVRVGGKDLALVSTSAGLFALDNGCPHSGGSLGEGMVQGTTLTCPLHGWQFDCKSGRCLSEKRPIQARYPVKVEKDQVLVEVPDPPQAPKGGSSPSPEGWVAAGDAASLRPGTAKTVTLGGIAVALVSASEGIYALKNACAHENGPLGEGTVEGRTITCPLHNWQFDCKTGRCLTDKRFSQKTYETKIEQGKVWVRLESSGAPGGGAPEDPLSKKSPVEIWKTAKHGIDIWPDILHHAKAGTPMNHLEVPDLERMKWYGYFYRKNNDNDHYMVRVRIPGCEMTADQARALAFISYESGYSIVDVTTRGNIQIQGLTIEKLPGVRAALEKVGLSSRQSGHDNVRNITSHPLSGLDPEELIDTRALAREMQAMIIGNRELSNLPRKFNVALTGRNDPPAHAWTQDLCFVGARGPDGSVGFHLLIGGNQGQAPKLSWPIPVFVRPEQVLTVTGAVLRTFNDLGARHNRHEVRFRYLIERLGPDQVLLEIEKRLGYELERFPKAPARPAREENFIGWFKQKQDNLWALGIAVPVGRLTWNQLEALAVISRQFGNSSLRTTYDQNLILPGIRSSAREALGYAIASHGLTFEPDSLTRNMVACTGKQFCNIAVTETKGYAYQLIEELRRRKVHLYNIRIHMSGCPSSCAMSYTADIGLKGVKMRRGFRVIDAFDVYLGGGFSSEIHMGILYEKSIPFDQLPEALTKIVNEFYRGRGEEETFSQYWRSKLSDHKAEKIKTALPRWRCSQCSNLHIAQDPPPFCPVCAALRARFEPAPEEGETGEPKAQASGALAGEGSGTAPAPGGNGAGSRFSWVCGSCNQKPAGPEPPELCPVCGAKKSEFRKVEVSRTAASPARAKPAGRKILIVGGSIGGHTAAQTAREADPDCQITLVTDERHSFYNRLNLTRWLAQEVKREELFDYASAWYEEQRIEALTGVRVIGLDPIKKTALLSEGRELGYDACILTHGSSANKPPFYRADLPGVYLLRTLEDVEGILGRCGPGKKVAIVGGGVLGVESAFGAVRRGSKATVFEYMPYLMPRQLDRNGAALLMDMVREGGIEAVVGVGVKELLGQKAVEGLTLADGRRFEADLVIVSTGIKPNIDWVHRSGIHCDRGIQVDDQMQTSSEGVFAAGDVVEWRKQVVGLWTNAIEQAKVAALNAVGKVAFFAGFLPVTILKCTGTPLVSMGEILEGGGPVSSKCEFDRASRMYRRIVLKNGIPIGGLLIGTSRGMGEMRKLIETGVELEKLKRNLVPEETAPVGTP